MTDVQKRIAALTPEQRQALFAKLKAAPAPAAAAVGIPRNHGRDAYPASFGQERLWFLQNLEPGSRAYTGASALRLTGSLDRSAFEKSLADIIRRHEVLRSRFERRDSELHQVPDVADVGAVQFVDLTALSNLDAIRREVRRRADEPFDLDHGPLFRTTLFALAQDDHLALFSAHHIVADGWSIERLANELSVLYAAHVTGQSAQLPDLAIQYGDVALWERQHLRGEVLDQELTYWRDHLKGLEPLQLTSESARVTNATEGATERIYLPDTLVEGVRALARAERATLFMTLLAAFKVVLYRYTRQTDLAVGSPLANRGRAEFEPLIGFFASLVVLRTRVNAAMSFTDLVHRVRDVVLGAFDHQQVPFEKLVAELSPERDVRRNPLIQTTFALQADNLAAVRFPGITVVPFDLDDDRTRFDLEMHAWERDGSVELIAAYNRDLFESSTIQGLLVHFRRILEAAVADPRERIDTLAMLTDGEREQILAVQRATEAEYPRQDIAALFEAQALARPEAIALESANERLSYRGLNERANQVASALRRAGVGVDSRVGVLLPKGVDVIVALLGILKAGGAYVALDPSDPPGRIAGLFSDAGVRVVIAAGSVDGLADIDVIDIRKVEHESVTDLRIAVPIDALAYVAFTSGSTGRPKGVAVTHRGVVRLLFGQTYAHLGPDEPLLQLAAVSFDASTFEIWGALLHGARLVIYPYRVPSPAELGAFLHTHGVRTLFLTTALYNTIIDQAPDAFSGLRHLLVGGEAASVAHFRRGLACLPQTAVCNIYGPTENTTFSTCHVLPREIPEATTVIPIGGPIRNTQTYVLDEGLELVPNGIAGELYTGGAGLARGYIGAPRLTAERFIPDGVSGEAGARLYRTGDHVRSGPDGSLTFLGRRDGQIKLRGYRIELGEVEATLMALPNVAASVARICGEGESRRLVAYVVPAAGTAVDPVAMRGRLKEQLPPYLVPSAILVLDQLPLNVNGKIDRDALPDVPEADARPIQAAPRTALEQQIAEVWCEVLGIDHVDVDQNFFDLGGHSLLLVRVHSTLKSLLTQQFPLVTLFQYPTIAALAGHLSGDSEPDTAVTAAAQPSTDSIAIIGFAGRFPGSPDVETFWANLRAGKEMIRHFTAEEMRAAGVPESLRTDPNFVPARGSLDDADLFDAGLFGYTPREAALLDPQQRVLLECAWTALEHAGCAGGTSDTRRVGVYVGSSENTYTRPQRGHRAVAGAEGALESLLAGGRDFLATRLSYKLNLRGPAVTVQTACSTSLVAVHAACQALRLGECDVALAGGVSITVPTVSGYLYQREGIASPDGHCRAFDAHAAGTVAGQGAGVVVLKPLGAAMADGDVIHAVIRGTAINNDGSGKVGFTAPSVTGQAEVITAALAAAGLSPRDISYVEAHGTGTALGDPIEIAALRKAFGTGNGPGTCGIGSVKSNLGHLDAAAGITSLIKTVLALEHRELPPTLHVSTPNPNLDLGPFVIQTKLDAWPTPAGIPRRAGVSSFGMGGTNAHVIVEEAPSRTRAAAGRPWHIVPLSGQTEVAVGQLAETLGGWLERYPSVAVSDVAYTQQVGRMSLPFRRVAIGRTAGELAPALRSARTRAVTGARVPLIWMFPGQGAQLVNMARELYETEAVFRAEIDACADVLTPLVSADLRTVLYPQAGLESEAATRLRDTMWTQVALVSVELSLAALWRSWGLQPTAVIGHSVGEISAACVAGVIDRAEALSLAATRGRLMQSAPSGGMVAAAAPADVVASELHADLWLAALNSPRQCVVSGGEEALTRFQSRMTARGYLSERLPASGPFHSGLMQHVVAPLTAHVSACRLTAPRAIWISTANARVVDVEEASDPGYWGRQVTAPVRWTEAVSAAKDAVGGHPLWLEVGPGRTLCHLVRANAGKAHKVVATLDGEDAAKSTTTALSELWISGVAIDWRAYHAATPRQKVALPTYPFQRQRYWLDAIGDHEEPAQTPTAKIADVSRWSYTPGWMRAPLDEAGVTGDRMRVLVFADRNGIADEVIQRCEASGHEVVRVDPGDRYARLGSRTYSINPAIRSDYASLIADVTATSGRPTHVLQCWTSLEESPAVAGTGVISLGYLAAALTTADDAPVVEIVVATAGVHDVIGTEALHPLAAPILGVCRVIPQEQPYLSCRVVDFEPGSGPQWSQRTAHDLESELRSRSSAPLVAYRGAQRWIEEFAERVLRPCDGRPRLIREHGVYVITGGFGRIGLTLAEYLARVASAKLVLIGRSPLPRSEEWDGWIQSKGPDDPTSKVLIQLRRIETAGGEILALSADVADVTSLREVFGLAEARYGRIDGVIHAAGITSGSTFGPVAELEREDLDAQFHPKIGGALALNDALGDRPLDFCALLSSVSTVLGGIGFGAYAGANAFLDAFAAAQTRRTGVPWISIGLDGWAFDGGESKRSGAAAFAMTPEEGVTVCARVLNAASWPRVLISTAPLNARRSRSVAEPGKAVAVRASEGQPRSQSSEYVAPRTDTEGRVAAIWEDLIGIAPIGVHDDFFELGGHSLLGTRLMSRVREAFDVELTLAALFADPNIAGLSARVDERRAANGDGADRTAKLLTRLKSLGAEDRKRLLEKARHSREGIA